MTEKLKNLTEISEILINYAETIIDLATELQYLLIEQEGIKEDKQKYSLEKMPELRECGGNKERTQAPETQMGADIQMQKLYVPIFRLSTKNICTDESVENS